MLEAFQDFIEKEGLILPGERVLLAVSGGMDSVVMTHLFAQAGREFAIAHVNFGLRGEESMADEAFVKKLAKGYQVPFYRTQFDTKGYAEHHGLSIQQAARLLRYQWFEALAQQEGYQKIATAHHRMDQAETILLNLSRGTGIAGFHGIPSLRGHIIRPIAFASKEALYDCLVENKLIWREDSSNQSSQYARNFIRHEVIPKLQELNPSLDKTMVENAQKVRDLEQWLEESFLSWRSEHLKTEGPWLYVKVVTEMGAKEKVMYRHFLQSKDFHYDQVEQILLATQQGAVGKLFHSPSHELNVDREAWVLSKQMPREFMPLPIETRSGNLEFRGGRLEWEIIEHGPESEIPKQAQVAYLDADLLTFPLEIRNMETGDWFCPLGMNQKKLISDFLTDLKVPRLKKQKTPLLFNQGSVAWVMGQRIDHRFKVSEKTVQALKMVWHLPN